MENERVMLEVSINWEAYEALLLLARRQNDALGNTTDRVLRMGINASYALQPSLEVENYNE